MQRVLKLYLDGAAIKEIPSSIGLLKNLKVLSFDGCKGLSSFKSTSCYDLLPFNSMPKSPHPVGLSSILGLCSLTQLNLKDYNLWVIPDDIGCLFSVRGIDLRENSFVCLLDSIGGLCKLRTMDLENCKSLRSLPKLPLSIITIVGYGCTSLETIPDLLKPNSISEAELYFSNCSKPIDNEGVIGMFFTVIRKHLQGLSLLKIDIAIKTFYSTYHIVIPRSVIPKWFSLRINGEEMTAVAGRRSMVGLLDHMWLFYLLPQYHVKEEDIKLLKDCEENEFSQIGIQIETCGFGMGVKKCGFRMVYKKDIEHLNRTVAQSNNTSIIPYVDLGVLHHNSAVVAEGNKAKQTHDHYDGAGPSGEASSNELPHPQGNERFIEFMAHGDSDCEEYLEMR
nr:disease resistance-like protein csa1 [Quercus suber]